MSKNPFTFFIWNPKKVFLEPELKPSDDDTQDAKIFYYSPSFISQEEKRSQVSLIEGLVDFTSQFDGDFEY